MHQSVLVATIVTMIGVGMASADPIFGEWKTETSDQPQYADNYLHVHFFDCDGKVCADIAKVVGIDADIVGMRMINDMKAKRGGKYSGGTIWAPDRDDTFLCKMQLMGDKLKVSGCIAGGLLCQSQIWTRVQPEPVANE